MHKDPNELREWASRLTRSGGGAPSAQDVLVWLGHNQVYWRPRANAALTLAAAATTFAATSDLMTITGDAGGNTIGTITGGYDGQVLTLIFVDGNVTVTDTDAHTADTADLSAAFTSADDTVLQLVYDGTSWYEVSRSVN